MPLINPIVQWVPTAAAIAKVALEKIPDPAYQSRQRAGKFAGDGFAR